LCRFYCDERAAPAAGLILPPRSETVVGSSGARRDAAARRSGRAHGRARGRAEGRVRPSTLLSVSHRGTGQSTDPITGRLPRRAIRRRLLTGKPAPQGGGFDDDVGAPVVSNTTGLRFPRRGTCKCVRAGSALLRRPGRAPKRASGAAVFGGGGFSLGGQGPAWKAHVVARASLSPVVGVRGRRVVRGWRSRGPLRRRVRW